MATLGNNVKTAFLKGLEALGKTATSLTDAAQQKLSEMNLDTRRRELLAEIPKCVMQLWKEGVELPEPLTSLLTELSELEEKLAAMRPQPEAKTTAAVKCEAETEVEAEQTEEVEEAETSEEPEDCSEEICSDTAETSEDENG